MAILFVFQNDKNYNQISETELNLNDLEKLTTEDEIRMDDQEEHDIDQVRGDNGSNCKNNLWRNLQVMNLKHATNFMACPKHVTRPGILHIHTMISK